jgi:hypothetical protein
VALSAKKQKMGMINKKEATGHDTADLWMTAQIDTTTNV